MEYSADMLELTKLVGALVPIHFIKVATQASNLRSSLFCQYLSICVYALHCGANLWLYAINYGTASSSPPVLRRKDGEEWGCDWMVWERYWGVCERVLSKYSFPCYMNYTYVRMYIHVHTYVPTCTLRTMSVDLTILHVCIHTYMHLHVRTCIHGVCTCICALLPPPLS